MSKVLSVFVAVLFVLPVLADDSPSQQYSEGKITSVSDNQVTLTDSSNKELTLRTSSKTQVVLNGKKSSISDLKEGQTISVSYSEKSAQTVSDSRSVMKCKLKGISEDRKTLQATNSDDKEMTFSISPTTRVIQNSKLYSGSEAKLENGQQCSIVFLRGDDRYTAVEIRQQNKD
jgi:hypothetical protein